MMHSKGIELSEITERKVNRNNDGLSGWDSIETEVKSIGDDDDNDDIYEQKVNRTLKLDDNDEPFLISGWNSKNSLVTSSKIDVRS